MTAFPQGHEYMTQQAIRFTRQGGFFSNNMLTPRVVVNGRRVPVGRGTSVIPVPPGWFRVDVSEQWITTYGHASLTVFVPAGGIVDVFYAAPATQFQDGAIGVTPQDRSGTYMMIGLFYLILFVSLVLSLVSLGLLFV